MPMMFLGAIFGVQLGRMMNEFVLMVSLMLLLAYAFYKSLDKAIQMRKHELGPALPSHTQNFIGNRLSLQVREPLIHDRLRVGPEDPFEEANGKSTHLT